MKRICVFIGFLTLLSACSKKSNVNPENSNSVTINGTAYPTVTIGNQVWTTVNYSGSGGYHSNDHSQYGDYYTQSQALAITLPSGWRVPAMNDYSILLSNFTTTKDYYGYFKLDGNGIVTLLSTSSWPAQGTNASGFNAQAGGLFAMQGATPIYESDGASGYFMTSDINNQSGQFGFWISSLGATLGASSITGLSFSAYSLRFVKDK